MAWKCFWVEPTKKFEVILRRFCWSSVDKCVTNGYHNAQVSIGFVKKHMKWMGMGDDSHPHDDPRWPKKCDHCDYIFKDTDQWEYLLERMMRQERIGMPQNQHRQLRRRHSSIQP